MPVKVLLLAQVFMLLRCSRVLIRFCVFARTILPVLVPAVLPLLFSGCMAHQQAFPLTYTSGAVVESLSGNSSLSYSSPDRSISGSGYLMYRKPDQVRMVVLSPFGSVLQEIYVSGEMVTIIDSGNGIAFSGNYRELSDKGDLSAWRHIRWLIDIDPPESSRGSVVIERMNRFGESEKATFENGLLVSKSTVTGGRVRYDSYTAVQGVAFPLKITFDTVAKEKFAMVLDDPEINSVFAEGAFTPDLNKYRVYPLSSLQ